MLTIPRPEHDTSGHSPKSPGLLNCKDAAAYLGGISTRHLYSLTAPRGPIPSVRLGNRVMYSLDTLRAYIDAELVRQNPPAPA